MSSYSLLSQFALPRKLRINETQNLVLSGGVVTYFYTSYLTKWFAGVACKLTPPLTLIALLSAPFALKAIGTTFKHHDNLQKMIPALGANVITVLSTDALLALGYFLTVLL